MQLDNALPPLIRRSCKYIKHHLGYDHMHALAQHMLQLICTSNDFSWSRPCIFYPAGGVNGQCIWPYFRVTFSNIVGWKKSPSYVCIMIWGYIPHTAYQKWFSHHGCINLWLIPMHASPTSLSTAPKICQAILHTMKWFRAHKSSNPPTSGLLTAKSLCYDQYLGCYST